MKKVFFAAVFMVAISLVSGNYSLAGDSDENLILYLGNTKTISVSNPTRIAISNPEVADVIRVTKREMTVTPKAPGSTTLVYWDNFGEQSLRVKVFAENTAEIKKRVDNVLAKLNISDVATKAEDEESRVYITGKVKSAQDKERISVALGALKDKVVDLTTVKDNETVIEIDVQVLELNKGSDSQLGFNWPTSINITEVGSPALATSPVTAVGTLTTTGGGAVGTRWGSLFKVPFATRDAFTVTLDLLIQEGKARILSRPRLACQSGKEAKLLVGGEVPVLSATLSTGGSAGTSPAATPGNVEYKEYGITLNMKPVVQDDRRIHLNLGVEVSELGDTVETTYALAYTFTKRSANTELYLDDGQTMVIGGLIKQRNEEIVRKFPWLADLPILGAFFRHRQITGGGGSDQRTDTELFITLTPRIVSEAKEAKETKETKKEIPARTIISSLTPDESALDPAARYAKVVQRYILNNLTYPAQAKIAGFQGTTTLGLKFSYRGELLDSLVRKSSGYKMLDDNSLAAAKNMASYPPFPPAIEQEELWIDVPITYQIE